jgi:hypothetical protein
MTRLSFDAIGQALSIVLRDDRAAETIELADGVLLDVDADGRPVALEFVALAQLAPFFAAQGGEYVLPERVTIPTNGNRQRT